MAITDIPILSMLRTRMEWQQERQRLLAENVANADTPNFKPRDLTPLDLNTAAARGREGGLMLARTDAAHFAGTGVAASAFRSSVGGSQVRPSGSAVSLEDEMLKVAANQMDYQTATALYGRSLGLIKTALGKK